MPAEQHFERGASLEKGVEVTLRKRFVKDESVSVVSKGQSLAGKLMTPVEIGEQIRLSSGAVTSRVRNMVKVGSLWHIETDTSFYTLQKGMEQGETLVHTSSGLIEIPPSLQEAQLMTRCTMRHSDHIGCTSTNQHCVGYFLKLMVFKQ